MRTRTGAVDDWLLDLFLERVPLCSETTYAGHRQQRQRCQGCGIILEEFLFL